MRLSIVIPAYNAEQVIEVGLERVASYVSGIDAELVLVDDGSTDGTRAKALALQPRYPFLKVLGYSGNRGKGYAVRQGVLASRGDYVLYTDADLVYPIEAADAFIGALKSGADVAIGARSHARSLFALHPRHFSYIYQRYLVGRAHIAIVNAWLGLKVTDTQCGFKLFRGPVAHDIFSRTQLDGFAFDVEVLYLARFLGYQIVELPVYFLYLGEQSSVELLHDSLSVLRSLAQIRWNDRRGVYNQPSPAPERTPEIAPKRP